MRLFLYLLEQNLRVFCARFHNYSFRRHCLFMKYDIERNINSLKFNQISWTGKVN